MDVYHIYKGVVLGGGQFSVWLLLGVYWFLSASSYLCRSRSAARNCARTILVSRYICVLLYNLMLIIYLNI